MAKNIRLKKEELYTDEDRMRLARKVYENIMRLMAMDEVDNKDIGVAVKFLKEIAPEMPLDMDKAEAFFNNLTFTPEQRKEPKYNI